MTDSEMTDSGRKTATEKNGCALLAGGEGKRLGGVNKAQLVVQKKPQDHAAETLLTRTVRIISGTGLPCYLSVATYELPVPEGWLVVDDRDCLAEILPDGGFAGPMGGIYSCLRKAQEDGLGGLFFVPCDAPGFEEDVIEKMLPYLQNGANGDTQADIVVWQTPDGRDQMTFAYYAVSCLPVLEKLLVEGRNRLRGLHEDGVSLVRLSTAEAGLPEERFRNINTPEDID